MSIVALENDYTAINQIGVDAATQPTKSNDELDQNDFIELLVAQMKNQDPSDPMDSSEFMSQLSQFSVVNGVEDLNTSFESLSLNLTSNQSMQAAALVGRDVLVPGGEGVLVAGSGMSGQISLPAQANDINLKIFNAQGVQVRELALGSGDQGELKFKWDGFDDNGEASAEGIYTITAEALIAGSREAIDVSLETRIDSINLSQDGSESLLNLASGNSVPLSFVQQIK